MLFLSQMAHIWSILRQSKQINFQLTVGIWVRVLTLILEKLKKKTKLISFLKNQFFLTFSCDPILRCSILFPLNQIASDIAVLIVT